jgi:hypothetical protein
LAAMSSSSAISGGTWNSGMLRVVLHTNSRGGREHNNRGGREHNNTAGSASVRGGTQGVRCCTQQAVGRTQKDGQCVSEGLSVMSLVLQAGRTTGQAVHEWGEADKLKACCASQAPASGTPRGHLGARMGVVERVYVGAEKAELCPGLGCAS